MNQLTLNNISVKNVGTADVFTLVNINIGIAREGYTDYNVDYWRNFSGEDVKSQITL